MPAGKSVKAPAVVMRPMRPAPNSVNQSAPSGPVVMPSGWPATGNSTAVGPAVGVMRPMRLPASSVNQSCRQDRE